MKKKKKQKYYAIYYVEADEFTISTDWNFCRKYLKKKYCIFKSFKTKEEAEKFLTTAKNIAINSKKYKKKGVKKEELPKAKDPEQKKLEKREKAFELMRTVLDEQRTLFRFIEIEYVVLKKENGNYFYNGKEKARGLQIKNLVYLEKGSYKYINNKKLKITKIYKGIPDWAPDDLITKYHICCKSWKKEDIIMK